MNARVLANTAMVRMIVGSLHVGTPDAVIIADMAERLDRGDWNAHERRRLTQYALAVHHRNQAFYRLVMGSW